MAAIFLLLVLGLFLFGGIAAVYSILRMIGMTFKATEYVLFGVVRGVWLFCRLAYATVVALYRAARDTRNVFRVHGLRMAQVGYVQYFVWSHMWWSGYIRRELQERGKSGTPSSHDM